LLGKTPWSVHYLRTLAYPLKGHVQKHEKGEKKKRWDLQGKINETPHHREPQILHLHRFRRSEAVLLSMPWISRIYGIVSLSHATCVYFIQVTADIRFLSLCYSASVGHSGKLRACVVNTLSPLPCSTPSAPAASSAFTFMLLGKCVSQNFPHIIRLGKGIELLNGQKKVPRHFPTASRRIVGQPDIVLLFRKLAFYFLRQYFQGYAVGELRVFLNNNAGKVLFTADFPPC
jgi:hypothetical protein